MSTTTTPAEDVLNRCYLEVRAKLLEVGACLDRVARTEGGDDLTDDFRMDRFQKALDLLKEGGFHRAERIQLLFSDPYDPQWKSDD